MFLPKIYFLKNLEIEEFVSKAANMEACVKKSKKCIFTKWFLDSLLRLGKIIQRNISGTSVDALALHAERSVRNHSCAA